MKQLMVQEASMEVRVRPFSDKGNGWRWPKETQPERGAFAFAFEGGTFVLTVPKPIEHSPDLRAVTILEAHERGVLKKSDPVTAIRLELGYGWHSEAVHHLARRAAFLGARIGTPMSVVWTPKRGCAPVAVEHRDPLADVSSLRRGEIVVVAAGAKPDFEALAEAVDLWLKRAVAVLEDAAGEGEDPVFPVIVLKSPANRIHPRIHWIASRLRKAGIPIETPDPEDAPPGGFVAEILETCLAHRRKILPFGKGASEKEPEHEHILPEAKRALALWKPLQGRLATGELMRVRDILDQFANLKSSQAFAVNLFRGLEHAGVLAAAIAKTFRTGALTDPRVHLEFYDPRFKAFLGESDHQTQVDVAVTALEGTVLRVFLIEVKLTEPHFGRCRGPYLEDNQATLLCGTASLADRCARCHLKTAKKRTYLDLAGVAFPQLAAVLGADDACPLRLDGYQLARNLCIRAWLAGEIPRPGVPAFPKSLARPGVTSVDARFAVVASEKTPAVSSEPLRRLGNSAGERLAKLGVDWVDARALLDAVRGDPRAHELAEYLDERYAPVFAPAARS